MTRGAIDLAKGLVRDFVREIVRVAKIGIPTAVIAMIVLSVVGNHPAVVFIGGLLAGLLAAAIAVQWANDSDDGDEWRARRRSGHSQG